MGGGLGDVDEQCVQVLYRYRVALGNNLLALDRIPYCATTICVRTGRREVVTRVASKVSESRI